MEGNNKKRRSREEKKQHALKWILDKGFAGNDQNFLSATLIDSVDKLKNSTEKSSNIANKLSKRILWLNIILAVATAVGAFAAIWMAFVR